jgi:hypothetical protein
VGILHAFRRLDKRKRRSPNPRSSQMRSKWRRRRDYATGATISPGTFEYFDAGGKPIRDEQRLLRPTVRGGVVNQRERTRLQIAYYKATGDDKTCLEILKSVVPFATSAEMLGWQMNKASLLAQILDASESLTSLDRSLQSLCGTLEQCLQWFAVELTITGGTPSLRATTKPTKRFRKLLTAAETVGSDDRGIKRSASASRIRSRAHTSNM